LSDAPKDAIVEVRKRIDSYLNIDVPLMVSRGQLSEPQLFELVGILGLWMLATVGMVEDDIAMAINTFLKAIHDTYADDPRSFTEKLHTHLESAFKDNPALPRLKSLLTDAMSAFPDDPAAQASERFLHFATMTTLTPETRSYFDVLAGV
jgi:hypothetical protein